MRSIQGIGRIVNERIVLLLGARSRSRRQKWIHFASVGGVGSEGHVCFGWMCKSLYDGEGRVGGKGTPEKKLECFFFVRRERNSTRFDALFNTFFFISILSLLPIHNFSRLVRV